MTTQPDTSPRRVQRTRRTGQPGMPPGAVYVGRPSRWGSRYRLGDTQVRMPAIDGAAWEHEGRLGKRSGEQHAYVHPDHTVTWHRVEDATPEQVVELYRRWLEAQPAELIDAIRAKLSGKDLACWCPEGQPCHADVLLELANGPAVSSGSGGSRAHDGGDQ